MVSALESMRVRTPYFGESVENDDRHHDGLTLPNARSKSWLKAATGAPVEWLTVFHVEFDRPCR
jgi:hypothetical protein